MIRGAIGTVFKSSRFITQKTRNLRDLGRDSRGVAPRRVVKERKIISNRVVVNKEREISSKMGASNNSCTCGNCTKYAQFTLDNAVVSFHLLETLTRQLCFDALSCPMALDIINNIFRKSHGLPDTIQSKFVFAVHSVSELSESLEDTILQLFKKT